MMTYRCIGVDNRQHRCSPDATTCLCGVVIRRKKLLKYDYFLFSYYECDWVD